MPDPSPALIDSERRAYERRPSWELAHVAHALGSIPWLNSEQEAARRIAVGAILKERARAKRRARA